MKKYENFNRRIKMEWVLVQEILIFENFKMGQLRNESQETAALLKVCPQAT